MDSINARRTGTSTDLLSETDNTDRDRVKSLILSTPEAARARSRIMSEEDLLSFCETDPSIQETLHRSGISAEHLAAQMYETEWLKATLAEASRDVTPVRESEVKRFYNRHSSRWCSPEKRRLRHILITVQDGFEENSEQHALTRISEIERQLRRGRDFGSLAMRHSECPTAVDGGQLGWVERGQLFHELEELAFGLKAGEVSPPCRTEMGWHLVACDEVREAGERPYAAIKDKLMATLQQRRHSAAQKRWVRDLTKQQAATYSKAASAEPRSPYVN